MKNGILLYLALLLGPLACAHEPKKIELPVVTAPPAARSLSLSTLSPAGLRSCSADTDCGDKQLCLRSQCIDITADLAECGTVRVHFDFNEANLHEDETTKLVRMGRCLKADHALHVTVEGNADERGTAEWNLALGDKRAAAVEDYLERLGVSTSQLKKTTFGEEHPLCTQHNEECWAKNRRAALKTQPTR